MPPTPPSSTFQKALHLIASFFEYLTAPPKPGDTSSRPPYDHLAENATEPLFIDIPLPNVMTIRTTSGSPRTRQTRESIPLELRPPRTVENAVANYDGAAPTESKSEESST